MACPRKNTGASSNGFVCGTKGGGTSRWMPTPWRASSISFSTKLKVNRRGAFFVTGRSAFREHDRGAWHYILSFRGTVFAAVLGLLWTAFWYFAQGRQPRLLAVAAAEVAVGLAFAFKAKYSYKSLVRQEVAATFVWYELFVTTCEKLQKMA